MVEKRYSDMLAVAAGQKHKEREYWLDKLSGELVRSSFPYDYKKTCKQSYDVVEIKFSENLCSKLIKLCGDNDHALHIVLATGLVILLARYTGQTDIMMGIPIYKQDIDTDFTNTLLPIRIGFDKNITFKELLLQVRRTIIEALENYSYPIEILLDQLGYALRENDSSLFDAAILLENIQDKKYLQPVNFNMIFSFSRTGNNIQGELEYNSSLYSRASAKRITTHFTRLFQAVLCDVNKEAARVEILSEEEKREQLYAFNDTKTDYPMDKTIQRLFEEQAAKTPDRIALTAPGAKGTAHIHLSYGELNKKSNQMAGLLTAKGVEPDNIVGLMTGRSTAMIVGLLTVLKAGGAYLPIDPDTPQNRIVSMLDDCNAALLLTEKDAVKEYSFADLQGLQSIKAVPQATSTQPQILALDGLPIPHRSTVDYEKYNQYPGEAMVKDSITLMGTRGCPYNCVYCHKIWPKRHVVRSAENIFTEVKLYYDMGVRRFSFIDDIFNLDKKNSMKFFDLIIENRLDVQFFFPNGVRGDILTKDYIDLMVKAGTIEMAFALETGSPRLQKLIRKNLNLEKLRENIEYVIHKYPHVILDLFTMVGFPSETEEEARMTLDFIISSRWLHFPYVSILKIYPNTDMVKLAVDNGVSIDSIYRSQDSSFRELPDTLPFSRSFTSSYQADFLNNYFLLKERLLHVLPYQMKVLTENEIVQKYNSCLARDFSDFNELLEFVGITKEELGAGLCLAEDTFFVPNLNQKLRKHSSAKKPAENALRILLIDLSQHFGHPSDQLQDLIEPPLGLMYLMTYLNQQFSSKINGKIAKSWIDFENYAELKALLAEFKPDMIGIRALTFYRNFFHKTISIIRQWGIEVPIITGGPYATSSYETILQDTNIDLVVLGEGEVTFCHLITKILENNKKLPGEDILREIPGLAFIPGKRERQKKLAREIIMMDELTELLSKEPGKNPENGSRSSGIAYVMFTSGSTGKPKGILNTHYNVTRVVKDTNYIDLKENDRILQLSNYSFDGSVFDLFGALLNGSTLVTIRGGQVFDTDMLTYLIEREKITIFFVTTALFNAIVETQLERLKNIKKVLFGGERVSLEYSKKAFEYLGKNRIIHMYGPTETTVYATYHPINQIDEALGTVLIGKPLANTTTYVLDRDLKLLPIGVAGELYIGGEGLARGYLNDPQYTAEKFIANPFAPGEQLYRTGDLVRRLPEGIQFLDRIDFQVKLRGFRVELGEIETRLLKHPGVKEAALIPIDKEIGDRYLCAYIVGVGPFKKGIDTVELKEYLSRDLPDYMIPSRFVQLESLPLTTGGKVNRKALPHPETGGASEYTEPRNPTEHKLAEIWSEVLGIDKEKVSIDADFFELGGHSLKATILISKIHKELDVKLPLAEVFRVPTIKEMAQYIERTKKDRYVSIEPVEKKEYYPLSSAQERLYFIQQMLPESTAYNITLVVVLKGKLEKDRLEKSFYKLIERHESLRTSYEIINGEPAQKIKEMEELVFEVECFEAGKDEEQIIRNFVRPFDLSTAPLFEVGLVNVEETKHIMIVDVHHIISDGVSHSILERDFFSLYNRGELPSLKLQYKDYSEWRNRNKDKETIKRQEAYWLKRFEGEIPALNLLMDKKRPAQECFEGDVISFKLGKELRLKLNGMVKEIGVTLYIILLTAYNILLSKYTGQEDIIVGSGIAARVHADLENIIGFFVNMLPMRSRPTENKSFRDFANEVKRNALDAYENQDYQFDELVKKLKLKRNWNRNPLFDTQFTYQNFKQDPINIGDLNAELYKYKIKTTPFDLSLEGVETPDTIEMFLYYLTSLFKRSTAEYITKHFIEILEQVVTNIDITIKDISISHTLSTGQSTVNKEDVLNFGF